MSAFEQIRQQVKGELFSYTELMFFLSDYKKPRDVVSRLLLTGRIIRIKKGLYMFGQTWRKESVSLEYAANLIYGPSAISLEYALGFYGLIPEKVNTITSVCVGRSRSYHTPLGHFSYSQMIPERFAVSMSLQKTIQGNFFMASPLKALADKVWTDSRFQPSSVSAYAEYLFEDLRIDETELPRWISFSEMDLIEAAYKTRKTSWLIHFLRKNYE